MLTRSPVESRWIFATGFLAVVSLCVLTTPPVRGGLREVLDRLAVMSASYSEQLPRVRAQQATSTRVFDAGGHQLQESVQETEVSLREWFAFFTVLESRHRERYYFSIRETHPDVRRVEFWPKEPEPPVPQSDGVAPRRNPLRLTASVAVDSHTMAWTCDARGWLELDAKTDEVKRAHLEAIGLPVSRRVWLRKVTFEAYSLDAEFEPRQLPSSANFRLNLPRNMRVEIRSNQGHTLIERRLERFAWSEVDVPAGR